MHNQLNNHWFWKHTIGRNRLVNDDLFIINNNIFFSVKLFYCMLFVVVTHWFYELNYHLKIEYSSDLLWPVYWTKIAPGFPWDVFFIITCFTLNVLVISDIKKRIWRILSFVFFFCLFAMFNSSGKINHSLHTLLIPLFCFMFINFKTSDKLKNYFIFASAVFALLTSYSLAGFWKILRGILHLIENENGVFSLNGMTRLLKYEFRYETPPEIAQWFMENEIIGFFMLWSGILIEFFSVLIFFFGKLHKIWGLLLLMLHISIAVIMDVSFAYAVITLLPLLIVSPFSNKTNFND